MPPKVKELIYLLAEKGFIYRKGKGSHRNYAHPKCARVVTLSGKLSADARKYQIKQVAEAIEEIKGK